MDISKEMTKLAKNVAKSWGLDVVETTYSKFKNKGLAKVFIAKSGGITIDDCTRVSRELGVLLDAEGIINEPYTLEVSSPGLDRPLKIRRDFERNIGCFVEVEYKTNSNKTVKVLGKLKKIVEDNIILENNEDTCSVPLELILKAKISVQL